MNFLIFGTGVIGSTIGWQLQKNNNITHFVRSNKKDKFESEGIIIQCMDLRNKKNSVVDVVYRPSFVTSLNKIEDYDCCFVSVKSNQLISILIEYQKDLTKIPLVLMQNIGLKDYLLLKDMFSENVTFAYPFITGGGRNNNLINCTIFDSLINEIVIGNFSGNKNKIEKILIEEFRNCRLKTAYSQNIVAYIKLHYVWATCVLASYIDSGSYENFIKVGAISKSYKAMVECFKKFRKEGVNSRAIFPYNLYHLPAILLGAYTKLIYNTKAMENMVVGHITSSPDEMEIMFNGLVEYCKDGIDEMAAFDSYIPSVKHYFDNYKNLTNGSS